jgi:hypothetical protein
MAAPNPDSNPITTLDNDLEVTGNCYIDGNLTVTGTGGGGSPPGGSAFSTQYQLTSSSFGGTGPGTSGQVLTSNGASAAPTFQNAGSGSGSVTNFSAGNLSPLFTTSVATSTTTPALTFTASSFGANTVLGSVAGGAPIALTATQLTTIPNVFTSSLQGVAPASGGGTSNFLRADGSWAAPGGAGGGTVTSITFSSGLAATPSNPITGSGTATLDLTHANTWTGQQIFTTSYPISNLNGGSAPTAQTGTAIQILGANAGPARIELNAYGGSAFFSGIAYGGTNASPTALTSGTQIGSYNSFGYNGTSVVGPSASLRSFANQNWSVGANGTYVDITTTPNGSATAAQVIRFENDGGITVPSTVTGGDQGAGTINAAGLFVNGVAVGSSPTLNAYSTTANATSSSAAGTSQYGLFGYQTLSATTTLTASSPAFNSVTGNCVITLPLASTCVGKSLLFYLNYNVSNSSTIQVQGSDSIHVNGVNNITATSMTLGAGANLWYYASGSGVWNVVSNSQFSVPPIGASFNAGGIPYGASGIGPIFLVSAAGTSGQSLVSGGAGAPTWTSSPTVTHQISGGTAPTVAVGAGAGTGGSPGATIAGHDTDFAVTLTMGTTTGTGVIFTVTFGTAYATAPYVQVTPASAATAALVGGTTQCYPTSTTTTMVLNSGTVGLTAAGAVYVFNVHCGQ